MWILRTARHYFHMGLASPVSSPTIAGAIAMATRGESDIAVADRVAWAPLVLVSVVTIWRELEIGRLYYYWSPGDGGAILWCLVRSIGERTKWLVAGEDPGYSMHGLASVALPGSLFWLELFAEFPPRYTLDTRHRMWSTHQIISQVNSSNLSTLSSIRGAHCTLHIAPIWPQHVNERHYHTRWEVDGQTRVSSVVS